MMQFTVGTTTNKLREHEVYTVAYIHLVRNDDENGTTEHCHIATQPHKGLELPPNQQKVVDSRYSYMNIVKYMLC